MEPIRSMLFTPGHRPDLIAKAIASGTDSVIVDLEDAVALEAKADARAGLASLPSSAVPLYVRVNGAETDMMWDDVVAVGRAGVAGLILPKSEDPGLLRQIDGALTALEIAAGRPRGATTLMPLIESSIGIHRAYEQMTSCERVESVLFASGEQGDLFADLGAEWTAEGTGILYARSHVLLAARAAGIEHPMDAVFMDFRNTDALRVECQLARRLGYVGKAAIHPAQVPVIHEVFTPPPEEVAHHRRIIEEFEKALTAGSASINVDGRMVDYAVARVARTVVARAEAAERAAARAGSERERTT